MWTEQGIKVFKQVWLILLCHACSKRCSRYWCHHKAVAIRYHSQVVEGSNRYQDLFAIHEWHAANRKHGEVVEYC